MASCPKSLNRAPLFTSVPELMVAENELYQYTPTATDDDGDTVTLSLTLAPAGMTLTPEGIVEWLPFYDDAGIAFNRSSGMRLSAFEHQIPEMIFSESEDEQGVSTAKALSVAMAQGQRIYTLTSDNASQLSSISIDDGARAEIQQALVVGLEVTVHEMPVNIDGWIGSGYTILDTEYGVGIYQISGGESGGFKKLKEGVGKAIFNLKLVYAAGPHLSVLTKAAGPLGAAITALLNLKTLIETVDQCWDNINIASAITIFALFAFLSAQLAISVSNPILGFVVGGLEIFSWNELIGETIDGLCPI